MRFHLILLALLLPSISWAASNLLENSSFELPPSRGWSWAESHDIRSPLPHNGEDAVNGAYSLKMELSTATNAQQVASRIYVLEEGEVYTLSYKARTTSGSRSISLFINNSCAGTNDCPGDSQTIVQPVTTSWNSYEHSFTTTVTIGKSGYQLVFSPQQQGAPGVFIFMDDMKLEQRVSATPWSATTPTEVDLVATNDAYLFFTNDTVSFNVESWNTTGSDDDIALIWEVYDYSKSIVLSGSNDYTVASGLETNALTISPTNTGGYVIRYWLNEREHTLGGHEFCYLDEPLGISDGSFGITVTGYEHFDQAYWNAGFTIGRAFSTLKAFRWSDLTDDGITYSFLNDRVASVTNIGFRLLATLGSEVAHTPSYAQQTNGFPDIDAWTNFVRTVITNHSDALWGVEIWNEPEAEGGLTNYISGSTGSVMYAELVSTAYDIIDAIDPAILVSAFTTADDAYVTNTMQYLDASKWDILGVHLYPLLQGDPLARMHRITGTNTTVINTETGVRAESANRTVNWPEWQDQSDRAWDDWGKEPSVRWPYHVVNYVRATVSNVNKVITYDGRNSGSFSKMAAYSPMSPQAEAGLMLGGFSRWIHLFDGFTNVTVMGQFEADQLDGLMRAYHINDRAGMPYVVLTPTNLIPKDPTTPVMLTIDTPLAEVVVYDVWGFPLTAATNINVSREGIIIGGSGITMAALTNKLSLTARSDTNAPTLILDTFPIRPDTDSDIRFRWTGYDDNSLETRWETNHANRIEYSWQLTGDGSYSTYTTTPWAVYNDVDTGNYTFDLRARDEAGNTGTLSYAFAVGNVSTSAPMVHEWIKF